MKIPQGGLRIDSPAFPLLAAHISYQDVTTADGNAGGTTLVCAGLANEPSYDGLAVKILSGGAAGQVRTIEVHGAASATLVWAVPFHDSTGAIQQITAATRFVILSSMAGGGGPGPAPAEGLTYYGIVDAVPGANQFTISSLAGLGAGKFAGATNPYQAFILRDVGGASAAPQGELQAITAYVTATGVFTTAAFTAAVAVGDEILIIHPSLGNVIAILLAMNVPPVDSAVNLLMRDVIGNKADTTLYAATLTDSLMRYMKAVLHTEVLAIGTFTTSSATVPADTGRTEADDAWKGCLLMPLVDAIGPTSFQPKRIVGFANVGGIFTMDPGNPFTSATGLVAYAILPAQADFVPAADSARNVSTPDVVGIKTSTAIYVPTNTADVMRYLKGVMNMGRQIIEPTEQFIETWQDEVGISAARWLLTNPATGTPWSRGVGAFPVLRATSIPALNETTRLASVQRWEAGVTSWGTNYINRRLIVEFMMRLTNVANIDNALSFFGLSTGQADLRTTDNLIAWALVGDALQTLTDRAGVEEVTTGFGETLTNWNKYRIECYRDHVLFILNETQIADHAVLASLPTQVFYFNHFIDTEAGGTATPEVGPVRIWPETIAR